MRIRKPRGVTPLQLVFVSVVGVLGGVYIWKPVFQSFNKKIRIEPEPELHNKEDNKVL